MQGNVTSQPECLVEENHTFIYVDMDKDRNKIDFADVAAECLNNKNVLGKVSANKPRGTAECSDNKLARSLALVRKEGEAKFDGLKMVAELESRELDGDSKNNGIGSMKYFRFEKALGKRLCAVTSPAFVSGVRSS